MPLLFTYPLKSAPPLAVYEQLEAFPSEPGPEALTVALPAGLLPLAARWKWSPSHAIVVFTGSFWGILTSDERDEVWNRWGVPIYEYRLNSAGIVIAQECDAHDGLHVLPGVVVPSDAIQSRCDCGQTSPRLPTETDRFLTAA